MLRPCMRPRDIADRFEREYIAKLTPVLEVFPAPRNAREHAVLLMFHPEIP